MGELNHMTSIFLEKCLQWLYVTRKKKLWYKIMITTLVQILFVMGISMILYILEVVFVYNFSNTNSPNFVRIVAVIVGVALLIFLLNAGIKSEEYSKILLGYHYLSTRRERKPYSKIKSIVIIIIIVLLSRAICKEIDNIAYAIELNFSETLIIGFSILALVLYIPLTECVIDEMESYRIKAIVSSILFIILIGIYITFKGDTSPENMEGVCEIAIFAIGQVAFAENAVSNYKNMYKALKEQKKEELEEYFQRVDMQYLQKEKAVQYGINDMKKFKEEMNEIWNTLDKRQRVKMVVIVMLIVLIYIIIMTVTWKLSKW